MQAQLMAALEQLKQAEIPVILTFGNHDYYKKTAIGFSRQCFYLKRNG